MQSIRKQLVSNYVLVALIAVLLLESMFMVVISQYYLGGVERILMTDVETTANFYNRAASKGDIYVKSNYIFENLDMDENALVEVLDLDGRIIIDSTGSASGEVVNTADFTQALGGNITSWTGRSELNELIIAVSAPIYDDNTVETIITDESWNVTTDNQFLMADFYDGETYDANVNFSTLNFHNASIEKVKINPTLIAEYGSPVIQKEKFIPIK